MTTSMAVTLPMAVPGTARCQTCPYGRCVWRVPLVRSYLYAAQAARQFRIPLHEAIRDNLKSAREDAGLVQRRRMDPAGSLDIAIVLEQIRDRHGVALVPWNAERIAALACPDRYDEAAR
jgi:hypothetical protein